MKKPPLQKNRSLQCGHAVVSYITGVSQKKLVKKFGTKYSLNLKQISDYLSEKRYHNHVVHINLPEKTFENIPDNSIIRIEKECKSGHFIIKENGYFLDPSGKKVLEYDERRYKATHYINYLKGFDIKNI